MNKYAARGLALAAALDGRRILIVTHRHVELRAALDELAAFNMPGQEVRRANGAEHITYPSGGSIRFATSHGHAHRGITADTVYLDGVEPHERGLIHELRACTMSSPTGEVVRA